MEELPNCKKVKTVFYWAPIETNKRIGIFSSSNPWAKYYNLT